MWGGNSVSAWEYEATYWLVREQQFEELFSISTHLLIFSSAPVIHLHKYQDRYTQLFGKNEQKMKFKLVFSVTYRICQTMLFFLNLFIITEVTPLSCSSLTPALFENKGLFRRECQSVVLCSDCYAAHVFVCVQMWDRVTWGTADKRVVWLRFISADAGFVTLDWPSLFPFHPLSVSHLSYLQLMVKTKTNPNRIFFFRPVQISEFKCFIIIKYSVIRYNEATVKAVSILWL